MDDEKRPEEPMLFGNDRIEQYIGMLQKEPSEEMLSVVLTAVRRQMKAGAHVIVAVQPFDGRAGINLKPVRTADGADWLCAFTSFEEQRKGSDPVMSAFTAEIRQVFETALSDDSLQGVIFNPWAKTLKLNKPLIRLIMGTGEG